MLYGEFSVSLSISFTELTLPDSREGVGAAGRVVGVWGVGSDVRSERV